MRNIKYLTLKRNKINFFKNENNTINKLITNRVNI